jgi:Na+-translocating ferredoxin:NAD+ oxidoreductase RnfD subunit
VRPAFALPRSFAAGRFLRTPKGQVLIVFLSLMAIGAVYETSSLAVMAAHLLVAVGTAMLLDLPYLRAGTGRWSFPTSALLTGLILAALLAPGTSLDIVAVASIVSILGKRFLRFGRHHLFNPAVLGLFWVGIQFGSGESWWGALTNAPTPWLFVSLLSGLVIAQRLNKLPLVLAFFAAYFTLWTIGSFFGTRMAGEMLRPPFLQAELFLVFFMLTDPPTSPNRYIDQLLFGLIAAVGSFAATTLGAGQLFLLYGALAGNLYLATRRTWQRRDSLVAQFSSLSRWLPLPGEPRTVR